MKNKLFEHFPVPMEQADLPHFEINGSGQFLADGCQGVLHYDESKVILHCESEVVEICGCGLSLNRLGDSEAEVKGRICSVKFQ
ncbi:MAG: YabP/YqfC family sporulation protein [Clostridia bacterium]|nr:YabP/YqfC family sporulation protein [Clostridia bacterium]